MHYIFTLNLLMHCNCFNNIFIPSARIRTKTKAYVNCFQFNLHYCIHLYTFLYLFLNHEVMSKEKNPKSSYIGTFLSRNDLVYAFFNFPNLGAPLNIYLRSFKYIYFFLFATTFKFFQNSVFGNRLRKEPSC